MKKLIFILIGFLFFSGCKKEPLTEEFQPLEGEWECTSVVTGNSSQPIGGRAHTLVFYKDGTYKIINKQDGGKDEKGRIQKIKFDGTDSLATYGYPPGSTQTIYYITLKKQLFWKDAYLKGDYKIVLRLFNPNTRLSLHGYLGFNKKANYAVYYKK